MTQYFTAIVSIMKRYAVVLSAFLIMMVSAGISYSFGVFLKPILLEFGWTRAMTSGAVAASSLVNGFVGIFMGGLTDRYGPRLVLSICGLIAGIGYFFMSQITEFWQMYLFYGVLIGVGSSTFTPLVSTVARLYKEKRTTVTGIVTVGIGVGSLAFPPLANHITLAYDWRTSFVALSLITIVIVVLSAQFLKGNSKSESQPLKGKSDITKGNPVALGNDFTFKDAVITRQFWTMFAMFFCMGFSVLTAQVHIFSYATDMNIASSTAATIMASIGGSSIIGRVVLGFIGDRIGNRRAFIIGFILMALPMFCLLFARDAGTFFSIAIIFGIGYGGCVASETPLAASVFGLKSIGLIFGFLCNAFMIGGAVGPVVAGYLFDVTLSYQAAFLLTAALGLVGLLLTVSLSPIRTEPR